MYIIKSYFFSYHFPVVWVGDLDHKKDILEWKLWSVVINVGILDPKARSAGRHASFRMGKFLQYTCIAFLF